MDWKNIIKREDDRYKTLNSAYNPDPDEEEDRYGEMSPDLCSRCGKEMGENEGRREIRLKNGKLIRVEYDDICNRCKNRPFDSP